MGRLRNPRGHMTTTLIRCPGCQTFRRPGPTCSTCEARFQQRRHRQRAWRTAVLIICVLILVGVVGAYWLSYLTLRGAL